MERKICFDQVHLIEVGTALPNTAEVPSTLSCSNPVTLNTESRTEKLYSTFSTYFFTTSRPILICIMIFTGQSVCLIVHCGAPMLGTQKGRVSISIGQTKREPSGNGGHTHDQTAKTCRPSFRSIGSMLHYLSRAKTRARPLWSFLLRWSESRDRPERWSNANYPSPN